MTSSGDKNRAGGERPPVIILGAARSGTKLLRSLIAATGCYAEIPFDVNYVWRYGNESCPNDELTVDRLTEKTREFVRARLQRCVVGHAMRDLPFVEKTVSNMLRVPFVKAIYPEAKFVAIVRDGRDVVESAERCWREYPRTGYLLAKLRTFPWRHCAPYAWKYAVRNLRRRLRLERHVRSWGPRYPGIDEDVRRGNLLQICARQWVACIEHYEKARSEFTPHNLFELRYEDLVKYSEIETFRLCEFLEVEDRTSAMQFARRMISADGLGSSRRLPRDEMQQVLEIIGPAMARWRYECKSGLAAA
jgi:hypothetical protein